MRNVLQMQIFLVIILLFEFFIAFKASSNLMGAYIMCLLTENQPRILFATNLILILTEFWIQSACRRHLGCDVNTNMKIGKQWNREGA